MKIKTATYIFAAICLIFAFTYAGSAAEADAEFVRANTAFKAGRFSRAAEIYSQIAANGKQSMELFYNQGLAYSKANDPIRAVLAFEKAKLLSPLSGDVNFALMTARNQAGISQNADSRSIFFYITGIFSPSGWAFCCGAFIFLLLAAIIVKKFPPSEKLASIAKIAIITSAACALLCFVLGTGRHNFIYAKDTAIVVTRGAGIYSTPLDAQPSAIEVKAGTRIKILDARSGMYHFRAGEREGWISTRDAEVI